MLAKKPTKKEVKKMTAKTEIRKQLLNDILNDYAKAGLNYEFKSHYEDGFKFGTYIYLNKELIGKIDKFPYNDYSIWWAPDKDGKWSHYPIPYTNRKTLLECKKDFLQSEMYDDIPSELQDRLIESFDEFDDTEEC